MLTENVSCLQECKKWNESFRKMGLIYLANSVFQRRFIEQVFFVVKVIMYSPFSVKYLTSGIEHTRGHNLYRWTLYPPSLEELKSLTSIASIVLNEDGKKYQPSVFCFHFHFESRKLELLVVKRHLSKKENSKKWFSNKAAEE